MFSCGSTNQVTPPEVDDEPDAGPDLVDLLPAGHIPPGFLPILQAYEDYRGDEVILVHADDPRLFRLAVFTCSSTMPTARVATSSVASTTTAHGVDHGVSLHVEDKLRTVLWGPGGNLSTMKRWLMSRRCVTASPNSTAARAHHAGRDRRLARENRCAAG